MILFFTKGDRKTGSSRQRVWNIAERLQKKYGTKYEVVHSVGYSIFSINPKRFLLLACVAIKLFNKKSDLFFVHKSIFPLDIVLLIIFASKLRDVPLVYDLDDAEWVHSKLKTKFLAKNADVVFCGSQNIKGKIEEYTNSAVLVPTVIDPETYDRHKVHHEKKEIINIGWVGYGPGYIRNGHLAVLRDALVKLKDGGFKFRLVFIGAKKSGNVYRYFSELADSVKFIDELDWSKEGVVAEAIDQYKIDIGVAPMNEDEFSKAKCAFKIIEYMAVGLPVIVSPVGEQRRVVRDKVDGFYARTVEEWVGSFKELADPRERAKMGRSGAQRVLKWYSYEEVIPVIAEALHINER